MPAVQAIPRLYSPHRPPTAYKPSRSPYVPPSHCRGRRCRPRCAGGSRAPAVLFLADAVVTHGGYQIRVPSTTDTLHVMARTRRWGAPAVAMVLVVAATLTANAGVDAHSSCINPLEYTWSNACRRGGVNGNIKWCDGPCPRDPVRKNYHIQTYRRGQWFPFDYYRNNHRGGFMRLSLVPMKHRFSHKAHDRNAFLWTCWDVGLRNCPRRTPHDCGTDRRGKRYRQWVRMPSVFPDGDYMLGYAWYGGGWRQGDYWSCARIRIRGGKMDNWHQPTFKNEGSRGGRCYSSSTDIGQCKREPCFRNMAWRKPAHFNGRKPRRISRWSVNK